MAFSIAAGSCTHVEPAQREVVLVGDSTMSAYGPERYPRMGWGMVLACGLTSGSVVNLAASGRSTRSFIAEGRWAAALDRLDRGDVALIQFGHNDQKVEDPTRFTDPDGAFSENLRLMVDTARARGATPVLITPVARRKFAHGGVLDTHGAYAAAVRSVARDRGVYLVDLLEDSSALLEQRGEHDSRALYLHYSKGEGITAYPDGVADDTHFSEAGARAMAHLVVARLAQASSPLRRIAAPDAHALRPGFEAGGPDCRRDRK